MKITKLELKNFKAHKTKTVKFGFGDLFNNITLIYGPNGTGKTSIVDALNISCNPFMFNSRDTLINYFRPLVYQDIANKTILLKASPYNMEVRTTFTENGYYNVFNTKSVKTDIYGDPFTEEDFLIEENISIYIKNKFNSNTTLHHYEDFDSPMNASMFFIPNDCSDMFEELCGTIYGLECKVDTEHLKMREAFGLRITEELDGSTQFYIVKNGTKVYYKNMSKGEQKIASLCRALCLNTLNKNKQIFIIDNIELHIYFKRHANMIDKFITMFPDYQFIATTHSETMINHVGKKYGSQCLIDLESP